MTLVRSPDEFWQHVRKTRGCWFWTGNVDSDGYGRVTLPDGTTTGAHRYAFELENGPLPKTVLVCHRCDTPPCVRTKHHFTGNHKENHADRGRKGRTAKGQRHGWHTKPDRRPSRERNGRAKLTEAQIEEIRSRYAAGGVSQDALAVEYGVIQAHVSRIVRGVVWRR